MKLPRALPGAATRQALPLGGTAAGRQQVVSNRSRGDPAAKPHRRRSQLPAVHPAASTSLSTTKLCSTLAALAMPRWPPPAHARIRLPQRDLLLAFEKSR